MVSAPSVLSMSLIILWMHNSLYDLHRTPSSLSVLPEVIHSLSFTVQWFLQHRQALQTCETKNCQLSWNSDTVTNCTNQKLIMTERDIKTVQGPQDGGKVTKYQKSLTSPAGVMWNVKLWQRITECQSGHNIKILSEDLTRTWCSLTLTSGERLHFLQVMTGSKWSNALWQYSSLYLLHKAKRGQYSSLLTVK